MRIAKRIALTAIASLAVLAMTTTAASADLYEGPIEGNLAYENAFGYGGLNMYCQDQSFSGYINDGASDPATGTIDSWDINGDCGGIYDSQCDMTDLPYDIEVHDDGTVRILDFTRHCVYGGTGQTLYTPAVEGLWEWCAENQLEFASDEWYFPQYPEFLLYDPYQAVWGIGGLDRVGEEC